MEEVFQPTTELEVLEQGMPLLCCGTARRMKTITGILQKWKALLDDAVARKEDSNPSVQRSLSHQLEDLIDFSMLPTSEARRWPLHSTPLLASHHPSPLVSSLRRIACWQPLFDERLRDLSDKVSEATKGLSVVAAGAPLSRGSITADNEVEDAHVGTERFAEDLYDLYQYIADESLGKHKAIFIVGGRAARTALAARAYGHAGEHFKGHAGAHSTSVLRSWVVVPECSGTSGVLSAAFRGFKEDQRERAELILPLMTDDQQPRDEKVKSFLRAYYYLLVLDDLQDAKVWDGIKGALPTDHKEGGTIIFTTSDPGLPEAIGKTNLGRFRSQVFKLGGAAKEDLKTQFYKRALRNHTEPLPPPELKDIGERVLSICQDNPFAVRTIAALLSTKEATPQAWGEILGLLDRHGAASSSFPVVETAFADLPQALKRCLLYCCAFPKRFAIPWRRLIRMLVAEGFVREIPGKTAEEAAEDQLMQLMDRNMIQHARVGMNGEVVSCRVPEPMRRVAMSRDNLFTITSEEPYIPETEDLRRLSIHYCSANDAKSAARSAIDSSPFSLRSLLFFRIWKPSKFFGESCTITPAPVQPAAFKLLRVLELKGFPIESVPDELGHLSLLRYLSLRGTGVTRLPASRPGKLGYLETLDIRETQVTQLPCLFRSKKLRHLHLVKSFSDQSVDVPKGLKHLNDLQTLSGVRCTAGVARELANLTQLRKLSIGKVRRAFSAELAASINKLKSLRSMTINCNWAEQFDVKTITPGHPEHLVKLGLGGHMDGVLNWVSTIQSITYLYLWDSMLEEDPLPVLQYQPNLVLLSLCNAYVGKTIGCDGRGFLKLKKLSVTRFEDLIYWGEIGSGAFPRLQQLFIGHCPNLERLPEGIDDLPELNEVEVVESFPGKLKIEQVQGGSARRFKLRNIPRESTTREGYKIQDSCYQKLPY